MTIAVVTGSAGFVGSHVVTELALHGYEVRALVRRGGRRPAPSTPWPANVNIVEGDITDPESLHAAFKGASSVFHIAALYREARFPDSEYFRVNTEGTRDVLDAARAVGVTQVIHCSTIGVHSHIAHPPADESEPYAPTDVYQVSKMEGEKIVREYLRKGWMKGAIIRPAMIWGPGDTRFLKMFRGIARRRLPLIGTGEVFTHWIMVRDLARAFRLAAEKPEANGEIFIIAGGRPVTLRYVYETIARELGVTLLPFQIPVWPIQLVGSLVEQLCRPFGIEPPLHRRRADFFIKSRAFNCAKAKQVLGFEAAASFEDEVREICGWYRDKGLLLAHPSQTTA